MQFHALPTAKSFLSEPLYCFLLLSYEKPRPRWVKYTIHYPWCCRKLTLAKHTKIITSPSWRNWFHWMKTTAFDQTAITFLVPDAMPEATECPKLIFLITVMIRQKHNETILFVASLHTIEASQSSPKINRNRAWKKLKIERIPLGCYINRCRVLANHTSSICFRKIIVR